MSNILVLPDYIEANGAGRIIAPISLGEFLLSRGHIPVVSFLDSNLHSIKEAKLLAEKYLNSAEKLILIGGNDINSEAYGEENYTTFESLDFQDLFEIELVKLALDKHVPIFGICRGLQIINIALGGNLYQDLETPRFIKHQFMTQDDYKRHSGASSKQTNHKLNLSPQGLLAKKLNVSELKVNSFHHQGIKDLGRGLEIEAQSSDGLVEAVSAVEFGLLGVQWHPEMDLSNSDNYRVIDCWLEMKR